MIFLILIKIGILPFSVTLFLILLFATALPDVDIAESWLSKKIKPLSNILHIFSKHRGFFHSLIACFFLSFIVFLIFSNISYAILFFIFYFLHLFLDMLNPSSIELFWPSKFKVKGFIKFGGFVESILFIMFSLVCILLIISLL